MVMMIIPLPHCDNFGTKSFRSKKKNVSEFVALFRRFVIPTVRLSENEIGFVIPKVR